MSSQSFQKDATDFYERSRKLLDSWLLISCNSEVYLKKSWNRCLPAPTPGSNRLSSVIHYEIHIIYSHSFRCPVFLFNLSGEDGKLLHGDQLVNAITSNKGAINMKYVSQMEHPFLGLPFYYIHPCCTHNFMDSVLLGPTMTYLISWLSIVGPFIGFLLDPLYCN